MKLLSTLLATAAALAPVSADIQSKPFHLVLESANKTIDGKSINACGLGGQYYALCVGPVYKPNNKQYDQTFRWNTTRAQPHQGLLVYKATALPGPVEFEETMYFQLNPSTNVVLPVFTPGLDGQAVHFDKHNRMFVEGFVDDHENGKKDTGHHLYRWSTCVIPEAYSRNVLAWTAGSAKPQNPTCQRVTVKRVFN